MLQYERVCAKNCLEEALGDKKRLEGMIRNMEKNCLLDEKSISISARQLDRQKRKTAEIYKKYRNTLDLLKGDNPGKKTMCKAAQRMAKRKTI